MRPRRKSARPRVVFSGIVAAVAGRPRSAAFPHAAPEAGVESITLNRDRALRRATPGRQLDAN